MSSIERPKHSGKLMTAVQIALASGVVATFGAIAYEKGEVYSHSDLSGRRVEDQTQKLFITDPSGDIDQIPLRDNPNLSDGSIVGYTKPGNFFLADQEYGVVYPSGQEGLGKVKVDDQYAGIWFKGSGLPLFEKVQGDKLVPLLDENGKQKVSGLVHVAGNFLRLPTETEQKNLSATQ